MVACEYHAQIRVCHQLALRLSACLHQLRGRYSVAPGASEYVDGGLFIGTTTGIYIAARIVLYVAGKGLAIVYQAGSGAGVWTSPWSSRPSHVASECLSMSLLRAA